MISGRFGGFRVIVAALMAAVAACAATAERVDGSVLPERTGHKSVEFWNPLGERVADPQPILRASAVTCPPGARNEGESNCGQPFDTVNGGCTSPFQFFSSLFCGDEVCGTLQYDGLTRDQDWYQVTITSEQNLTFTVTSDVRTVVGFASNTMGTGSCSVWSNNGRAFFPSQTIDAGETVSISQCLAPGTYWFIVQPDFDQPAFSCGARYVASLDCTSCVPGACCVEGVCQEVSRRDLCEDAFGVYLGDGSECGPDSCAPPENNDCEGAIEIQCGQTLEADLRTATLGDLERLPTCRDNGGTKSVWFRFQGTGDDFFLSTCASDLSDQSADDSVIAVYQAADCDGLLSALQVGCNDNAPDCGGLSLNSELCVPTELGETYFVQVLSWSDADAGLYQLSMECGCPQPPTGACCSLQSGDPCTDDLTAQACRNVSGQFLGEGSTCAVEGANCPEEAPENGLCFFAEEIGALPAMTTGTNLGASQQFGTCSIEVESVGAYYVVVGTGNVMTASTCNPGTDFDTKIHVYCEVCEQRCVANNDSGPPGCGSAAQTSWCSELGREYMIMVSGNNNERGNFTLTVEDGEPCSNAAPCLTQSQCSITVPPGAIGEGEPLCSIDYVDETNAGCDRDPALYTEIEFGNTYTGRSGTFTRSPGQIVRDRDALEFTLESAATVNIDFEANFMYEISVLNLSCNLPSSFAFETGTYCQPTSIELDLQAGSYSIVINPQSFQNVSCFSSQWVLDISKTGDEPGACCTSRCACQEVAFSFCQAVGGTFFGEGVACDDEAVECDPCQGDANGDDAVTIADVLFIIARFGEPDPDADVNCDSSVTIADVLFTIARFGQTCGE